MLATKGRTAGSGHNVSNKNHQPNKPKPEQPPQVKSDAVTPHHERCPLCFSGRGGVGKVQKSKVKGRRIFEVGESEYRRRNYKCDKCSWTWSILLKVELIRIENINH